MVAYKCRRCGSVLQITSSNIAVCRHCGAKYSLPKSAGAASGGARGSVNRNAGRNTGRRKKKNSGNNTVLIIAALLIIAVLAISLFVVLSGNDQGSEKYKDDDERTENNVNDPETEDKTETETKEPETTEEPDEPEEPEVIPEFKADLSDYEMYMNPTGDQRDAYLVVVNVDNPLPADYKATDMINVKSTRKDGRQTQQLREYAAKALEALMLEAEACGMIRTNTPSGYPLSVMSAYRSYEYQGQLFNQYVNSEMANRGISRAAAEKIVEKYSNRPGTSEHQAGLCVDMHTHPSANQGFKNEPEAKWLAENCYKFGFILRYPEDKMEQTKGIMYEPWHFRYVGRYHATKMHELNMCLEEYVEYLENKA